MSPCNARVTNGRRGFNLIEAAIVLGVIGLVIGGIWYAASRVHVENRANIAFTDITQAIQKLDGYEMWQIGSLYSPMAQTGQKITALGLFDSTYSYTGLGYFRSTKHDFSFDMTSSSSGATYFKSWITAPSSAECVSLLSKLVRYVQARRPTSDTLYANAVATDDATLGTVLGFCPNRTGAQRCAVIGAVSISATDIISQGCQGGGFTAIYITIGR